ncbi:MAG: transporter [Pseudomonadota bacterium]
MSVLSPLSKSCIFTVPAIMIAGAPVGAEAAPVNQVVQQTPVSRILSPDEAKAETARIMARLKALNPEAEYQETPQPSDLEIADEPPVPTPQSPQVMDVKTENTDILGALTAIRVELAEQKKLIADQRALIQTQNSKIRQLELRNELVRAAAPPVESPFSLSRMRGAGVQQDLLAEAAVQTGPAPETDVPLPDSPVGEAPPQATNIEQKVEAVPEGQGVLTPQGQFVLDPSIEYTRSSTNRLVFRGIELIPGIQIGAIEASDADRDTVIGTFAMRYGLTRRLEIEGRIPLLYRKDRIQVVQQREDQIVREIGLNATDIGDAEFSLRYQLNSPKAQNPIWVAGLRVKTDTGVSPYEVPFDEFGVATGLATGSGFWGIQPSMSFLLPSDPVVIYGGLGYLWNIERDIDRIVGDVLVGNVDPGDAINASVGFGFALNPRFSFSLGYRHNYIFSTRTELGDTVQNSNDIQVGSFNFGMSYRLSQRQSLNLGFQFGVTEDAPDVGITMRIPFRF